MTRETSNSIKVTNEYGNYLKRGYLDLYSKGGKIRRIFITDALCLEALDWCKKQKRHPDFFSYTQMEPRLRPEASIRN